MGFVDLEDPETGEIRFVDTGSRRVRNQYAERFADLAAERDRLFRRMDTETIDIRTDESYVDRIALYFRKREKRR